MSKENCSNKIQKLQKNQNSRNLIFPANVFGYLALCENLKEKIKRVHEGTYPVFTQLPFVSNLTSDATPQGAVYAHWSFLKY